ncbi:MAG: hemerythrin domain-containing protein [Pseudonocardiaceae bacterium]
MASTTDSAERRELADTVISEVVRHSVTEEMYVYPAMREHLPNGDHAVEHDTQEHKQLAEVM